MKALILGVALVFAGSMGVGGAAAQTRPLMMETIPEAPSRPVVVELFSSQNCVKCPPANKNVAQLAKRRDVVALTYPVGYWDYLGATDKLAKPAFTERQKRYNQSLGHRGPYTPQIVFSGMLHSSGGDLAKIAEKFAARDTSPYPVRVDFDGVDAVLSGDTNGPTTVMLVRFRPGQWSSKPSEGENRGVDFSYYNLVTHLELLGKWSGGPFRMRAGCVSSCVVLVHAGGSEGPIIGVGYRP